MCFASNPTLGTWKLNESKSTFGDGAGKSTLVVWEKVATSKNARSTELTLTVRKLTASGPERWTAKIYAITGDPQADQRSFKRTVKTPSRW